MRQRVLCFSSTLLLVISLVALGMANPAYAQSDGCEDERAFGLKIKKIVKARNLKKLTELFESEDVLPAHYLKGKTFSDVFSDKWRTKLLRSKTVTVCEWYKGPVLSQIAFTEFDQATASGTKRKCCKIWEISGWIDEDLYGPGRVFGPRGAKPSNVLDVKTVRESPLLWALHLGSYKLGAYDTLGSVSSEMGYLRMKQFEGLRLTIAKDGVTLSGKEGDVKASAKYFGAAFHLPHNGHCGSAGCSVGISGHSYIYKLSKPIIMGEYSHDFRYIIIAFNSDDWAYNRVFLSTLSGWDEDYEEIDLHDMEQKNFQTTKSIRQPAVDRIQTVSGKALCRHVANADPDAVKEARRRNLTKHDCQKSIVSNKGQIVDGSTFPGIVSYKTFTTTVKVEVFATEFFWLEPIGKDANDVNQREERAIKLTFKEGANKYETHAIAQSLGDTLANDFKYYVKESHFTHGSSCQLIDPNCRENLTFKTTFRTTSVDLNGDGADEVIVTLEAPNICGSGGCTDYILDSSSGVWKVIGKRLGNNFFKSISRNRVNGYSILYSTANDGTPLECVFDGKRYTGDYCD